MGVIIYKEGEKIMIGIFIGLALLIILAYRGWSILWIAPLAGLVVALFGGVDLLQSYVGPYMSGLAGFVESWFPVFMLGAIFGNLMEKTGMAQSVAKGVSKIFGEKQAITSLVLAAAALSYGGISVYVVVFAVYPIGLVLFEEGNVPKQLMPATIWTGMATFAMVALPGTPQIQNLIPMAYLGTPATAAPILGLTASAVMGVGGIVYLRYRTHALNREGKGFAWTEDDKKFKENLLENPPNIFTSLLPLVVVIVALNIFQIDIITSILLGIITILIFSIKDYKSFIPSINGGATDSISAIMNTAAAVGFGTVVQSVPGFETLKDFVLSLDINPLVSVAVSTNILAGATGSAGGGLAIAMDALGDSFAQLASQTAVSLEAIHRVASISSAGLDTLPHNGAVITILTVTALTHKESYKDIFVVGIAIPVLSLIPVIILGNMGIA